MRMPGVLLRTTETVDCEHAASRATSVMVTRFDPERPPLRLRFSVAARVLSGSSPRLLSILSLIRPAPRFRPPRAGARAGGDVTRHLSRNPFSYKRMRLRAQGNQSRTLIAPINISDWRMMRQCGIVAAP